ncbi:MAG: amidohydrolase family protein [Anaerolineae bacterium]
MGSAYDRILAYVQDLDIVDTHEHLPGTEATRDRDRDVLQEYLSHYMSSDLRSAGLSSVGLDQARDHSRPLMDRWLLVEPYWERARYTGYGRALDISVRKLYGLDGIRRDTIEALDAAFRGTMVPGHYHRVLRELSQIAVSLLDVQAPWDPAFFRPVTRLEEYIILPQTRDEVSALEEKAGFPLQMLDAWMAACEASLLRSRAEGSVAIKIGLAYVRSLEFQRPLRRDAEAGLRQIQTVFESPAWEQQRLDAGRAFQDWMMHHVLELARREQIPVQIHTGLLEGNGNLIANADPTLLNPLFLEYPDVNFDLFHIGYPYQHVLSALAKMFPNVYIDMCWAHIISPTASVRALEEWIDSVPLNKICAFGGDYGFVDAVYGHQAMARENVARALAIKVDEGIMDVDSACEIGRWLFVDNPSRLFKLGDSR